MELIPAIDLLGGRVVRLAQGDYDAVTSYDDDPVAVARRWEAEGAPDSTSSTWTAPERGDRPRRQVVERVVAAVGIPCQVAGGLRTAADAAAPCRPAPTASCSAARSSPTRALRCGSCDAMGPSALVAALDVRDGRALGDGWVAGARGADAVDHARRLADHGVRPFRGDRDRARRDAPGA